MSEDAFFKNAREKLFPKLKSSALSITIVGDPDPKLCMELGASILFDKPIICVVPAGLSVSSNLRRVATTIVQGDLEDPETKTRLEQAVTYVIENDARVKKVE